MNKLFFTLLALVFVAGVMVVTCPGKEMHKESIQRLASVAMKHEIERNADYLFGIDIIDKWVGNKIADYALDNWLIVENYFVYSVGYIECDGEKEIVSVGAFNHIFTAGEQDVIDELNNN